MCCCHTLCPNDQGQSITSRNHDHLSEGYALQVRDPRGTEIYKKDAVDVAEASFKSQLAGPHTFCFTVSAVNTNLGSGIASPRVGKRLREISIDIQVGETWSHERVTTEHMDSLMEEISALKTRIQKLKR